MKPTVSKSSTRPVRARTIMAAVDHKDALLHADGDSIAVAGECAVVAIPSDYNCFDKRRQHNSNYCCGYYFVTARMMMLMMMATMMFEVWTVTQCLCNFVLVNYAFAD